MKKQKPTIYLDTNILSVLFYRGANVQTIHRQMVTREWWETERSDFRVWASDFTEGELRRGIYPGQDQAIAIVRRLPYLPSNSNVLSAADRFVEEGVIPPERPGDALHLAFATIHRIDYLLTWNYAHLANADTQRRLIEINRKRGWRSPILVSPETIPRATLDQTIRRRADD